MKFLRYLLYLLSVLTIIYLFGPHPEKPVYAVEMPAVPAEAVQLEAIYKRYGIASPGKTGE